MSALQRAYRLFKYSRITRNPAQLALLTQFHGLSPENVTVNGRRIHLQTSDLDVSDPRRHFLLQGIEQITPLLQRSNARLYENEEGAVMLEVGGIRLLLVDWEELFIAHEIFHRGIYCLRMDGPYQALDIGMNVATASLAFAADPLCHGVTSYELFPQTFNRAARNLALNPGLSAKITAVPAGLAQKAATLELDYCPEVKGSTGLFGIAPHVLATERGLKIERVKVTVLSAADEIRRVLGAGSLPVVCKIDCEGAEYEILDAFAEGGILAKIGVLMLEWHWHGPARIEAQLAEAGFRWLSQEPHAANHGMIYAWQSQR